MKAFLILFFIFITAGPAQALPVLNESVANREFITIFPDSKDPDLFYIGPHFMTLADDEQDIPLFSYTEYRKGLKRKAIVQTVMKADFHVSERDEAIAEVKHRHPKARFANLPFISSQMIFHHPMGDLIDENTCNHPAGQIGDEISCSFRFNAKGIKYFRAQMSKNLTFALNFEYGVAGCLADGAGGCEAETLTYAVAARITSDLIRDFPELFRDSRGRKIDFHHP